MGRKFIDLTGKKFGKLTALEPVGKNKRREIMWLCQCDCGNQIVVSGYQMRRNHTKSCGCLQKYLKWCLEHKDIVDGIHFSSKTD